MPPPETQMPTGSDGSEAPGRWKRSRAASAEVGSVRSACGAACGSRTFGSDPRNAGHVLGPHAVRANRESVPAMIPMAAKNGMARTTQRDKDRANNAVASPELSASGDGEPENTFKSTMSSATSSRPANTTMAAIVHSACSVARRRARMAP